MKLFPLFLLCSSLLFAKFDPDHYRRLVTSIEKTDEGSQITLSDDTTWNCNEDLTSELPPGTEVSLSSNMAKDVSDFWLKYQDGISRCSLTSGFDNLYLTIKDIYPLCVEDSGWFSNYVYIIELSDHSKWKCTNNLEVAKWIPGNRIVVSGNNTDWKFYNLDEWTSHILTKPNRTGPAEYKMYLSNQFEPYLR
jgi:hypothetical protein